MSKGEMIELAIATVGMGAALLIFKKDGCRDTIKCLKEQGCTVLDSNGNVIPFESMKAGFRNPFKK